MGEVARHILVQESGFHAELLEERRQDDAAHAVDGVHTDTEMGLFDGCQVNKLQLQDAVNVPLVERMVFNVAAQMLDVGIFEVFTVGNGEHFVAVGSCQELSFGIEQLQRIPLSGVVRGCDDDAAVGTAHPDGQLGGGSCGIADVENIVTHAHQRTADDLTNHGSGDTSVSSDNDFIRFSFAVPSDERGIGCCKLHNVQRVQGVPWCSADGTADA